MSKAQTTWTASFACVAVAAIFLLPNGAGAASLLGSVPFPASANSSGQVVAVNGKVIAAIATGDKGLFCYDASSMSGTPLWSVSLGVSEDPAYGDDSTQQNLPDQMFAHPASSDVFLTTAYPDQLIKLDPATGSLVTSPLPQPSIKAVFADLPAGDLILVMHAEGFDAYDAGSLLQLYSYSLPAGEMLNIEFDQASSAVFCLTASPSVLVAMDLDLLGWSNYRQQLLPAACYFHAVMPGGIAVCASDTGEVRIYGKSNLWPTLSTLPGLEDICDFGFIGGKLIQVTSIDPTAAPGTFTGAYAVLDTAAWSVQTHQFSPSYPLSIVPSSITTHAFILNPGTPEPDGTFSGGALWVVNCSTSALDSSPILDGSNVFGAYDALTNKLFVVEPETEVIKAFAVP